MNEHPGKQRVKKSSAVSAFKYWRGNAPGYMKKVHSPVFDAYQTLNSEMTLGKILMKISFGASCISSPLTPFYYLLLYHNENNIHRNHF